MNVSRRVPSLLCACLALGGLLIAAPGDDAKIESSLLSALTSDEDVSAPFFIVFGEKPDLSAANKIQDKTARGKFVGQALKDTADKSQNGVRGYLQGHKIPFTAFWIENKIYVPNGTLELARDLSKRNDVVAIIPEKNYTIPQPQGGATIQAAEWGIGKIRADQVWPTTRGAGIVVANIDTGVQFDHPALVNQYRGKNANNTFTHAGNWFDPSGTFPSAPGDNVGHGSHTMGTMIGSDGGSNLIGVAPGAKWIACKGCASNSCSGSNLISCAQWVLDPLGNNSMTLQPDVVNNSWGGGSGSTWYQSYIDNWVSAGIFPAFSAGNSGPTCGSANSPGDNPSAFASGATDGSDSVASFSSRGPSLFSGAIKPDVSAPGVSVRSSVPTNGYAYYSGTSMASPHTAGTVALIWAAAPGYLGNVAGTEQLLKNTAVKLTNLDNCGATANLSPNDSYGFGRIDALAAVNGTGAPPNQPPTVTITSPSSGAQKDCGVSVPFTGSASDPENGDRSPYIEWTEAGSPLTGSPGPTASKTFDCTNNASEFHTINAKVTDLGGLSANSSVTITIVNNSIPAAPTSLSAKVSGSTVTLTWSWPGGVGTGYRVQRKLKSSSSWTPVTDMSGTTVKTLTNNPGSGQWQYRVFALNGSLQSASSNIASARVR